MRSRDLSPYGGLASERAEPNFVTLGPPAPIMARMTEAPPPRDRFSSRFGLILAALGMAVGAGNIWRFPRIMAKFEDGGTFLLPWAIFLFTWSIPLLIVETTIGRKTRRGVIGSMGILMGKKNTWIGSFVALCTVAIMCYYSVVAGWCAIYVVESLRGQVAQMNHEQAGIYFSGLAQGPWAALGMVLAFGVSAFFVKRGLGRGVELANRILLPLLFLLLVMLLIVGLGQKGSGEGIAYMFRVNWSELASSSTPWLEGLTQSAWSTGAGWGLLLVLSVGSSSKGHGVGDAVITGVGNYCASILAAMATIPAVFALAPLAAPGQEIGTILSENGPGGTGMAMIWLPRLFAQVGAAGPWLSAAFFVALTFAATTSLIAMVELGTRSFMDMGMTRERGILACLLLGLVFGLPSALSLGFLANQDWAWGLGLIVSGAIFTLAVGMRGFDRFRREWITTEDGRPGIGAWFNLVLAVLIPLQFVILIGWWFYQTASAGWADKQWNPLEKFSIATCLLQWGLAFLALRLLNPRLSRNIP